MTDERRKPYPFDQIEPKWQARWERDQTFRAPNPGDPGFDPARPKYYILDMFPYPSGAGLHVGHPEGYTATDIIARAKRMQGYNVLHPMGWDAFGLPAEQYAIKTGQHPAATTARNIAHFKAQLARLGFSYDWSREVNTTDPAYYRWTQWIFLQLYNAWFNPATGRAEPIGTCPGDDPDSARLAYVSEAPVNWCPALGTVLANEEVIDGLSEVGGHPVERRPMRQWMLRITAFAERLLAGLGGLDWPESIKGLQRNWIGRSEGAEVEFAVEGCGDAIHVFTTRPDTLFGATYMVLAPEHPLVDRIASEEQAAAIEAYREKAARKSDLERAELSKEKSGVFTGARAINPVNGEPIPIWIADYVLMGYGTGAIMAVPAHDARDFEFARAHRLPVVAVVTPTAGWLADVARKRAAAGARPELAAIFDARPAGDFEADLRQRYLRDPAAFGEAFAEYGDAIHSPPIDGLPTADAKRAMIAWLEERGLGRRTVTYKLRDWLFSRQRYWGEPFPVTWRDGAHRPLAASDLPLELPAMEDFKPTGTPEPPLAKAAAWANLPDGSTREFNTMPQWAGSCWYYLRYIDPANASRFVGETAERYWMGAGPEGPRHPGGVDLYVGGTEHAVLHLLYARFWHQALFDLGHVSVPEPFQRLVNQGIILGEDGQKMSKSRGNVVNPDDVVDAYGADAFRLYEMFMGPLEQMKPWSTAGVEGVSRFLARVWRLALEENQAGEWVPSAALADVPMPRPLAKVVHATVKKVGDDIASLAFNTAIAQMMVCTNALTAANPRPREALDLLLRVLAPFAPHLAEELWERLGFAGASGPLSAAAWPDHDPALLVEDELELPVQVNGKVRDRITIRRDTPQGDVEALALGSERVAEFLAGKTVRKVIVVPGKLVNIVATEG